MLGDFLSLYVREQTCEVQRRALSPSQQIDLRYPQPSSLGVVPRLKAWEPVSFFSVLVIKVTHSSNVLYDRSIP